MFSKILIATDLSAASHAVVRCAAGLRSLGAKECLLLQCMNVSEPAVPGVEQAPGKMEQALIDQKAFLEQSGLRVRTEIVPGFAKVEISRIARERRVSLIVVGSHGHSLLGEMLLGGVADAVLHQGVSPVLLVRVERESDGRAVRALGEPCDFLRHILFPTDFSDNAHHALQAAKHLCATGPREVTLLHVQDKHRIDPHLMHRLEEFNEIDRKRLEGMKSVLTEAGAAEVNLEIRFGYPAREILRAVAEREATLVVMGSQGRGFIEEIFLGSVSHNVARRSTAPILLIPARR